MSDNSRITTVINYCSNDYRFINKCIEEAKKFSYKIIVPVCSHFFDGTPENEALLQLTYSENPSILFIQYDFHPSGYSPYKRYPPESPEIRHLHHSTSRYIAYFFLPEDSEYVLFIDADEIYEGENFKLWLETAEHTQFNALRIGSYIYFAVGNKIYRGDLPQIFGFLAKKTALTSELLLVEGERFASFKYIKVSKKHMVLDKNSFLICQNS